MARQNRLAAALLGLMAAACASQAKRLLVDPFPLSFPLVEAGSLVIDGGIEGQPWARDGVVNFRTRDGSVVAVVASSQAVLARSPSGPSLAEPSRSPEGLVLLCDDDVLRAVGPNGRPVWEFRAEGAIRADPVQHAGRVYFGDSERMFYCLAAATGKVKWRRRLQGAPLHPAAVRGGTVVVAASNSVVYRLSRRGGSILSWESVPSRVVYEPALAGSLVLVSSATPAVVAVDLRSGKRAGQYEASGPLVAGAVWSPPYVVLFVEDADSGRQRLVFLSSR